MRRQKLREKLAKKGALQQAPEQSSRAKEQTTINIITAIKEVETLKWKILTAREEKKDCSQNLILADQKIDAFFKLIEESIKNEAWDAIAKEVNLFLSGQSSNKVSFKQLCADISSFQLLILTDKYQRMNFSPDKLISWFRKLNLSKTRSFPHGYTQEEIFSIADILLKYLNDHPQSVDLELVEKFAKFGHENSIFILCKFHHDAGNLLEAIHWGEQGVQLPQATHESYLRLAEVLYNFARHHDVIDPDSCRRYLNRAIFYYEKIVDRPELSESTKIACNRLIEIYSEIMPHPAKLVQYCRKSKDPKSQILLARVLYSGARNVPINYKEARKIIDKLMLDQFAGAEILAISSSACYSEEQRFDILDRYLQKPEAIKFLVEMKFFQIMIEIALQSAYELYHKYGNKEINKYYLERFYFYKDILQERCQSYKNFDKLSGIYSNASAKEKLISGLSPFLIEHSFTWLQIKKNILAQFTSADTIDSLSLLAKVVKSNHYQRHLIDFMSEFEYEAFLDRIIQFVFPSNAVEIINAFSQLQIDPNQPKVAIVISQAIMRLLLLLSSSSSLSAKDHILLICYKLVSGIGIPEDINTIIDFIKIIEYFVNVPEPPIKHLCIALYALNFLHLNHKNIDHIIFSLVCSILKTLEDSKNYMNYFDLDQLKTSCVYFSCVSKRLGDKSLARKINKACGQIFYDIATKVEKEEDLTPRVETKASQAQLHIGQELSRYVDPLQHEVKLVKHIKKQPFIRVADFIVANRVVEYDGLHHHLFRSDQQLANTPKTLLRNFLLKYKFKKKLIQLSELSPDFPSPQLERSSFAWSRQCFIFLNAAFKSHINLPIINFYIYLTWEQQHEEAWRDRSAVGGYITHFDLWHQPDTELKVFKQSRIEFYCQLAITDRLLPAATEPSSEAAQSSLRFIPTDIPAISFNNFELF